MFTGIVDHVGTILAAQEKNRAMQLKIQTQFKSLVRGESIAMDGICLTVENVAIDHFSCTVSPETYTVTTIKNFKSGTLVNLERALRLGDAMGGHWVNGHVDTQAVVMKKEVYDDCTKILFELKDKEMGKYLIKKGSVAVNGVSLTLNEVEGPQFQVMLIPETLKRTNLSQLVANTHVNIECDWMAKLIVEKCLSYKDQIKNA